MRHHMTGKCRQQGAVLVVGLIMLLLLTLIGVAGMRDTLLQEKMTGASRDRGMALQAAETALRAAETQLRAATALTMTNSNGLYGCAIVGNSLRRTDNATCNNVVTSGTALSETAFWQLSSSWSGNKAATYTGMGTADGLNASPQYIIEKLPAAYSKVFGSSNSGVSGGAAVTDYRITARAVGATADSVVILQTTFRRLD
jgi:type IV pilus assembly protein PilX